MNPFQMMQAFKNPQQFVQSMLGNSQIMQNPFLKNTLEMAQKGNAHGVEEMARNLCREKGIDPEEAIGNIKKQLGM